MKNILIRVDSSSTIGLGHLKRTLVLAQRLKEKDNTLNISFATQALKGNINSEILKHGFNIYNLSSNNYKELNSLIDKLKLDLLIIDSYKINYQFETKIKKKHTQLKVLAFDDLELNHNVDIILNHGFHCKKKDYLKNNKVKLLCGSKYTLLRDEFFKKFPSKTKPNTIAIILGGNDVLNLSAKISKLLLKINAQYKISIITTSVNQNLKKLQTLKNVNILVDIDNIAETLSSAEFIITASGGSLFEIMALNKKFINIQVASNQQKVVDFLNKKEIYTTIQLEDLTKKLLRQKIKYILHQNIYKQLKLKFSKYTLTNTILELITK